MKGIWVIATAVFCVSVLCNGSAAGADPINPVQAGNPQEPFHAVGVQPGAKRQGRQATTATETQTFTLDSAQLKVVATAKDVKGTVSKPVTTPVYTFDVLPNSGGEISHEFVANGVNTFLRSGDQRAALEIRLRDGCLTEATMTSGYISTAKSTGTTASLKGPVVDIEVKAASGGTLQVTIDRRLITVTVGSCTFKVNLAEDFGQATGTSETEGGRGSGRGGSDGGSRGGSDGGSRGGSDGGSRGGSDGGSRGGSDGGSRRGSDGGSSGSRSGGGGGLGGLPNLMGALTSG